MTRILLFVLTNLGVMLTVFAVVNLLGIEPYLNQNGLNLQALLIFCLLWGFTGSFISLLLSKRMAMWTMRLRLISPDTVSSDERFLMQSVAELAEKAGIKMPDVGIYEGEANAFATGAFKNSALVGVSTGLMRSMNKEQIKAVLAHEIGHIANGDMVTLTLIQGVVNAFTMFLARVLSYVISSGMKNAGHESAGAAAHMILTLVFDIVFSILGSLVVRAFSRLREFRADASAAHLMGTAHPMISALQALKKKEHAALPESMAALGISGDKPKSTLSALFSTHPDLNERIAKLQKLSAGIY